MFPILSYAKVQHNIKWYEKHQGKEQATHDDGIIKVFKAKNGHVVKGSPQALQARGGEQCQSYSMEEGIKEISEAGEDGPAQQEPGEVHPNE